MSGVFRDLSDGLAALEQQLLQAIKADDKPVQVQLYRLAGAHHLRCDDVDQACFYLTNAWVLSLEIGDPLETELHQMLAQHGRL